MYLGKPGPKEVQKQRDGVPGKEEVAEIPGPRGARVATRCLSEARRRLSGPDSPKEQKGIAS